MARKTFLKNVKAVVALATMATLVMSSALPVYAVGTTNTKADRVAEQKAASKQMRNVMYYGDWSIWGGEGNFFPKDMAVENLTHLNLAFMDFTANGELVFCDKDANIGHPLGNAGVTYGDINGGIVNEFQSIRQKNPNLKIGLSLGGWSKSNNFTHVARNPQARANFIKNVMDFVRYANMDFIDFDWEYPTEVRAADKNDNKNDMGTPDSIPADKENYITLLKEFRAAADKQGAELGKYYELSAALPMAHGKTDNGIDVKEMFNILDFGNIMTYDAAGAWDDVSGHQAALYDNPNSAYAGKGFSVDSSIKHYLEKGAPSEKLVIGAAYYTRGWEKVSNDVPDPKLPGLYGKATAVNKNADGKLSFGALNYAPIAPGDGGTASGVWGWRNQADLKTKYPGLKEYWDDTAKAPYLYSESTGAFFTYDNVRSIQEKAKYVHENNLGGMIAWMASQDAPTASGKRDELTKATKNALFGTGALPTYNIVQPANYASLSFTTGKPDWGNGGKMTVSLKNDAKLTTSAGETLKLTETAAKTLKHTKLYIKTKGVKITGGEYPAPAVKEENGYYTLSFDGSDQKLIKPGETKTFNLTTDKVIEGKGEIVSIEIGQRMHEKGPEISRYTLYSDNPVYADEDVNRDFKVDVLDLSAVAAKYNKAKGQTGYDEIHDITKDSIIDLFDLVRVAKKLDTTSGGGGGTTDPEEPTGDTWDANKSYKQGETCIYKGVTYKAKWESKGETPGQPWNAWEKVN